MQVTPGQVGRYLDSLPVAVPTRKVHLSALRRFFDELVLRHVLILNPALSVRAERFGQDAGDRRRATRGDCSPPAWECVPPSCQ